MQYTKEITVTAGTSNTNRETTFIKLAAGVIHKVDIVFPPGCRGLTHVVCYFGSNPVIPSTELMSYSGDGEAVTFPEFIKTYYGKNKLRIDTWNTDDTNDHTIMIRIYVLKKKYLLPAGSVEGIIAALGSLFTKGGSI